MGPFKKKLLFLVALLLYGQKIYAEQVIAIHLGLLSPIKLEIVETNFLSKLKSGTHPLSEKIRHLKLSVEVHAQSSTEKLISSLQNDKTAAVLWIGEGAATLNKSNEVMNVALMEASGVYVPKKIFSAATRPLPVGVALCTLNKLPHSYTHLAPNIQFTYPQIYSLTDKEIERDKVMLDLFLVANLYTAPHDILKGVVQNSDSARAQEDPNRSKIKLEIEYRDLRSKNYGYSVSLGPYMIGVLRANKTATGRIKNRSKTTIWIPPQLFSKSSSALTISPDDPKRKNPPPWDKVNPVDDILIDSIKIYSDNENGIEILEDGWPIHIGDDDSDWDKEIGLFDQTNFSDFAATQRLDQYEATITLTP